MGSFLHCRARCHGFMVLKSIREKRSHMRIVLLGVIAALAAGCVSNSTPAPVADPNPPHPSVRIQGVDGTIMTGELLNGSVTVDSGQGPLTLLTDHVSSIDFSPEADTVDSPSVKVAGKIKEPLFMLK